MVDSVVDKSFHANSPMRQKVSVAPGRVETGKVAAPVRNRAESYSFTKGQVQSGTGMYVVLLRDTADGEVRVQVPAERAASTYRKSQSIAGPVQGSQGGEAKPRQTSPAVSGTDRSEANTQETPPSTAPGIARGDE
jgi:hypothetical protein